MYPGGGPSAAMPRAPRRARPGATVLGSVERARARDGLRAVRRALAGLRDIQEGPLLMQSAPQQVCAELGFDRALLVTVLGEIPKPQAALREIFEALKRGGLLSVTEIIFDPHFQTRTAVRRLAEAVGFREQAFHGNRIAFTVNFAKPTPADTAIIRTR